MQQQQLERDFAVEAAADKHFGAAAFAVEQHMGADAAAGGFAVAVKLQIDVFAVFVVVVANNVAVVVQGDFQGDETGGHHNQRAGKQQPRDGMAIPRFFVRLRRWHAYSPIKLAFSTMLRAWSAGAFSLR